MSRRISRTGAIAIAVATMALASAAGARPAAAATPDRPVGGSGASCDERRPFRLGVRPAASGTLVVACGSLLVTRISLENVSNTLLRVTLPAQTTWWRVVDPLALTFGTQAALAAVPGGCYRRTLVCDLPSGSTVYADGSSSMRLRFSVDYGRTIKANSARFLGQWIQGRFTSPSRRLLNGVVACADDAKTLAERRPERTWEDALRLAITSYLSCSSLVKAVRGDVTTRAQRAPVARQVVRLGKMFAGGSWIDQLTYVAARIIRR